VSRITTGKLVVRKSRVELQAVLQNAVELSASFIEKRGHTLEVALPDAPVWLEADATRLSQVFSNLLNNAAKYTNAGGHIRLTASVAGGDARVEVSDNGIGIAPAMLPLVFDMFTQADYSLERSNAGLGVGLSLARRLVELHDGRLEAHSEGSDRGSTFTVTLPLAGAGAAQAASLQPARAANAGALAPRRILLADDNIDFVQSLENLLTGLGHEVRTAHDGEQAFAAAQEFLPEFAFLDIGLPKLNGYSLARRLRSHTATRDCVLIAVTGWGQARDRELARDAGFDHHMVKPVEPGQLRELLAREWRRAPSL
jgi:CheY-like chemotaxis protein